MDKLIQGLVRVGLEFGLHRREICETQVRISARKLQQRDGVNVPIGSLIMS